MHCVTGGGKERVKMFSVSLYAQTAIRKREEFTVVPVLLLT